MDNMDLNSRSYKILYNALHSDASLHPSGDRREGVVEGTATANLLVKVNNPKYNSPYNEEDEKEKIIIHQNLILFPSDFNEVIDNENINQEFDDYTVNKCPNETNVSNSTNVSVIQLTEPPYKVLVNESWCDQVQPVKSTSTGNNCPNETNVSVIQLTEPPYNGLVNESWCDQVQPVKSTITGNNCPNETNVSNSTNVSVIQLTEPPYKGLVNESWCDQVQPVKSTSTGNNCPNETNVSNSTNVSIIQLTEPPYKGLVNESWCDQVQPVKSTSTGNNSLHLQKSDYPSTYIRKPDFCYFCETYVLNFARHIKRNHSIELEVSEIFSKPIKSKERRQLLDHLRRKGNFLKANTGPLKPVRKSYLPDSEVLPCDNCLGYFSSKLLYRHRKKCRGVNNNGIAQSAGQSTLFSNIRVDHRLKTEVFPHMRGDKVSLEAKKDALICAFGARYLNTHREQHFVQVTSRKMRELAKILIEIRKLQPAIGNMFQALQPKHFDLFVEATKHIARYDAEKNIYEAPTFAMNISTSLKQCCDIAINFALKRHGEYSAVCSADAEANLRTLIHLFDANWRFEISSQAANCLNLNKWNKITIVPLASDLILLKQHLIKIAEEALKKLKRNRKDEVAYSSLMESVYCRVLLLNRKRPGELQRMLKHTYLNCLDNKEYEEFNKAISPTEQILLKKLKRVVIKGKRGRGVPVLFSTDVQEHIKFLFELREIFVPKDNPYLFGKINSTAPIIGYKILQKYAISSGAKNPSSITSTRLRKHLATLSQLFNLTDNEIEQLATFMGHTPGVHKNSYRLPDGIYQTAKISKLLLIMEKGGHSEFKGKSLDEIDIDMEENLLETIEDNDGSDVEDVSFEKSFNCIDLLPSTTTAEQPISKQSKIRTLVPWTSQQKKVVRDHFKNHIETRQAPKRFECDELKEKYSEILGNKNWLKIKVFIQNEYSKNKKHMK